MNQHLKVVATSLLVGFSLTVSAEPTKPVAEAPAVADKPVTQTPTDTSLPLDDLRVFVEVFHKVKRDYVEDVTDKKLLENAIRGMLEGLDPHSAYLDETAYSELQEGTTGEFGGLGIEIGSEDGLIKIISPIDDTPASRAGIQAGDTIIRLDGAPVRDMSINEAVKKMRGEVGTSIELTLMREGVAQPLELQLVRDRIKIRSVRSRELEPGLGYLRVSAFQANTGDDFVAELGRLKAGKDGLKGLILDLRNNPGGVLGAAVAVSDAFLESGRIVYTEGRVADARMSFDAKAPDLLAGAPLVVLINEGSASASEIVAGALQDRGRAVLMGRKSFGKGSVQTILPMNDESAIKITTARYFTPSGRSIQAQGVVPDIEIGKVQLQARAEGDAGTVSESQLDGHLDNPNGKLGKSKKRAAPVDLAARDYELFEALNLLKGLTLTRQSTANPTIGSAR
jgi:carboxyl-terminal processing protease